MAEAWVDESGGTKLRKEKNMNRSFGLYTSLLPLMMLGMLIVGCQRVQADDKNIKKIISTPDAPEAIGPYSQGVLFISRGLQTLYCSGQIALDPKTGEIVPGTVSDQARRVMDNLKAIITAGGLSMADVVKTTIYLTDLAAFTDVNNVYMSYFSGDYPARVTVQVAALPKGALVEMDAVAVK